MPDKTPTPAVESDFPVKAGKPARQALIVAGYHQLADLTQASEKELLALHGVGPKAVRILREALAEKGLAFKE
ncbi:DNA-binding protein [Paenibacillus sp. MDMC362]|uniref:DNA-binding protein n=1 Tax=Paenibacillus sp. MDMC362 TaxID=2977365 RepID=UPI000DC5A84D|nr:DNA-binding protein [Paenibacillus sp. MDMC362]RAR41528.1 DNA-binding protein [Paenibacillus sp. MDMC362]